MPLTMDHVSALTPILRIMQMRMQMQMQMQMQLQRKKRPIVQQIWMHRW